MKSFLKHLIIPHEHNNFRAKILHNSGLLFFFLFLFALVLAASVTKTVRPDVLGISYSISENEMLTLTNKIREQNNLPPLSLNEQLSKAAFAKAQNMLQEDYWSHFAPNGTTPWEFIAKSGYNYIYAGENLARGFTYSDSVVDAWMQSSTHRDNILSDKFQDVGFAFVSGKLKGEETVLIVEMFGSKTYVTAKSNNIKNIDTKLISTSSSADVMSAVDSQFSKTIISSPMIDLNSFSKALVGIIMTALLLTFVVDMVMVERKKIPRLVGHNMDHIMIFSLFLIFLIATLRGGIL